MIRPSLSVLLLAALAVPALAAVPAHMELKISGTQSRGGTAGSMGAYGYNAATDTYWTILSGGQTGIRRIDGSSDDGRFAVFGTTLLQFMNSADPTAGVTNPDWGGGTIGGGLVLNPKAITIDFGNELDQNGNLIGEVTYQPGELAYITDLGTAPQTGSGSSATVHLSSAKRLYRYDLRTIESAVSGNPVAPPDRNNAQSGDPLNPVIGKYGQVDWNDALSLVASEQDLRDAAGDTSTARTGTNFGRQVAWSSDGQSIYAVDSGNATGGVFKIDAATGDTVQLYREALANNVIAEPAVVASSVHAFGDASGDQILIDGAPANGNDGGISYVVDDGTEGLKDDHVLIPGTWLREYVESATASAESFAADSQGNVYVYVSGARGLFKYDTQGRLVALVNDIQLVNFNQSVDGGAEYRDSGGMKNLQVVEDESGTRIFYRSNNKQIASVMVGKTGDFTNDGVITSADTQFFIDQFRRTTLPGAGTQAMLDYGRADLNASSRMVGVVPGTTTPDYTGELTNFAVNNRDLDVLRRFINLRDGDTDWNFTVDIADFQRLRSNFNPVATDKTFFDGNFDYANDGNVDIADFQALRSNFNPAESYDPEPVVTAPLSVAAVGADLEAGEIVVEVDVVTGAVRLVAAGVEFESFQIVGSAAGVLEANYLGIAGFTTQTGDAYVASLNLTGSLLLNGALDLGAIYNASLDLRDFSASFGVGTTTSGIAVNYIPEPTSVALLGIAVGGMVMRRKNQG